MKIELLKQMLKDAGLEWMAKGVQEFAVPCIDIKSFPTEDSEISISTSKFGGEPDVPGDFVWPQRNNLPLAFLAQINLAEIAHMDCADPLPRSGLLSFFFEIVEGGWGHEPEDRGSWRVYYFPTDGLSRVPVHADLIEEGHYKACKVSFEVGISTPCQWLTEYFELNEEDQEKYDKVDFKCWHKIASHHLLGDAEDLQGSGEEMKEHCQSISGSPDKGSAAEWRLLFQCVSDKNPDWMWGDLGRLYFWIREKDLAAGMFDDVWMIEQC